MVLNSYIKYLNEQKDYHQGMTTEAEATTKKEYKDNHYHKYKVDENGNGETTETIEGSDHVHKIVEWKVHEAHEHTHKINKKKGE